MRMGISFVFAGTDIQPSFSRGGTLRKDVTPGPDQAVAAARRQELTTG